MVKEHERSFRGAAVLDFIVKPDPALTGFDGQFPGKFQVPAKRGYLADGAGEFNKIFLTLEIFPDINSFSRLVGDTPMLSQRLALSVQGAPTLESPQVVRSPPKKNR